jgi:hypothetical protein
LTGHGNAIFSESDFHKANIRDLKWPDRLGRRQLYDHIQTLRQQGTPAVRFVDIWLGNLTERIIDHLQGIEDLKEKMRKVLLAAAGLLRAPSGAGRNSFYDPAHANLDVGPKPSARSA